MKVKAQPLVFFVFGLAPALGYVAYAQWYGPSEEEKQQALRPSSSFERQRVQATSTDMKAFFNKMKSKDASQDGQFQDLLKHGRGGEVDPKRPHE